MRKKILTEDSIVRGTNYIKLFDGTLIQWGNTTGIANTVHVVYFPIPFFDNNIIINSEVYTSEPTSVSSSVFEMTNTQMKTLVKHSNNVIRTINWIAFGRWK